MTLKIADLRAAAGGLTNLTDYEIAQAVYEAGGYKAYYPDFNKFAATLGLETGSKTGNRFSASIDNYQAGLYGLVEAGAGALGADGVESWAKERRTRNELAARNAQQLAQSQGAVERWDDVHGLRDFGDYAAGLAIQSLPYMAEAAAGGLVARGLMTGTRAALGAARASGGAAAAAQAARRLNIASTAGAATAGYPSAVGDVLQSQRDQAGETDLDSALALGAPYAALNAGLGVERVLARGALARNTARSLDNVGGVRGAAARAGATAATTGLGEGVAETGQEVLNQLGRMAVDPSASLTDPAALDRYTESFIGGATLGGIFGAGAGGWRRSEGYTPLPRLPDGSVDLTGSAAPPPAESAPADPPRLGYSPLAGRPVVFPDGSVALNEDEAFQYRYRPQEMRPEDYPVLDRGLILRPGERRADLTVPQMPGVSFEPPAIPEGAPAAARPGESLQVPLVGGQADLFDPLMDGQADLFDPLMDGQSAAPSALETDSRPAGNVFPSGPDLFTQTPSATVRVDFDLRNVTRELAAANGGRTDSYVAKLAKRLADTIERPQEAAEIVEAARFDLEARPLKPETIERRTKVLNAAEALLQRYAQRLTDAYAQEAASRRAAGEPAAPRTMPPDASATVQQMRERNAQLLRQEPAPNEMDVEALAPERQLAQEVGRERARVSAGGLAGGSSVGRRGNAGGSVARAGRDLADVRAGSGAPGGAVAGEAEARPVRDGRVADDAPLAPAAPPEQAELKAELPRTGALHEREQRVRDALQDIIDNREASRAIKREAFDLLDALDTQRETQDDVEANVAYAERWLAREVVRPRNSESGPAASGGAALAGKTPALPIDTTPAQRAAALATVGGAGKVGTAPSRAGVDSTAQHEDGRYSRRQAATPERMALETAFVNLLDSPAAPLARAAARLVRLFTVGTAPAKSKSTAHFVPEHGVVWFNESGVLAQAADNLGDPAAQAALAGTLAHELVHVADHESGGRFASSAPTSPTKARIHDAEDTGTVKATLPPVMYEVFRAWLGSTQLRELGYPLGQLYKKLDAHRDRSLADLSPEELAELDEAVEHAANETPAVLVELYLRKPEALQRLAPRAFAFAESLAKATTLREAQTILRGSHEVRSVETRGLRGEHRRNHPEVRASVGGYVQAEVRSDADARQESNVRGVRGGAEGVSGGRGNSGGAPPDRGSFGDRGLSLPPPVPGNRVLNWVKDRLGSVREGLGWLTMRQIGEQFSDVKGVALFTEASSRMGVSANRLMGEAHRILTQWRQDLDAQQSLELMRLLLGATINKMHLDVDLGHAKNRHLRLDDPRVVKTFGELRAAFLALSEATNGRSAALYKSVLEKFESDRNRFLEVSRRAILRAYEPDFAGKYTPEQLGGIANVTDETRRQEILQSSGLSTAQKRALRALWGDLDEYYHEPKQLKGPYFPIMRFGDYVIVFKSPTYLEYDKQLAEKTAALQELYADENASSQAIAAARQEVADAKRALELLKADAKHYVVEFWESQAEARARLKQLQAIPAFKDAYLVRRPEYARQLDSASPQFMRRLEESLKAAMPTKDAQAVRATVRDLFIRSLPERSALKAQLQRLNVPGAKVDEVQRAFAAAAVRNAWAISRLEHGDELREALAELRAGRDDRAVAVGNELTKRFMNDMEFREANRFLVGLSNLSYMTYLGFSPSFYLTNMSQPWTVSVPLMAARHGLRAAGAEMLKATGEVMRALKNDWVKGGKTTEFDLDLGFLKDEGERRMVQELLDKGIIDITIEHDLGTAAAGGSPGQGTGRFARTMNFMPRQTEIVNRVATALAAYRLERKAAAATPTLSWEPKARAYAERMVVDSHLDYTPENAPRLMRAESLGGLGRLVWQFKKYQQGMIYLHVKLAKDFWQHGDKEAGRQLVYLLGASVATAGVAGGPIFAGLGGLALAGIAKMWPDDDEPDIRQIFYQGLKDAVGETAARAIMKGLPAAAGLDLSQRLGMGSMSNPFEFARTNPNQSGQEWMAAYLLALAGPWASIAANLVDAVDAATSGQYVEAAKRAMPKVVSDMLKAYERADQGITSRRGEVLLSKEEIGDWGWLSKALGFESTSVADMYELRAAIKEKSRAVSDARSEITRAYALARRRGDGMADVQERVREFNARNPEFAIKPRDLVQAYRRLLEAERADRLARSGSAKKKADRAAMDQVGLDD